MESVTNIKTKAEEFYQNSGELYLKIEKQSKEPFISKGPGIKIKSFAYPSPLKNTCSYIKYDFKIHNYNEVGEFFCTAVVDRLKHLYKLCNDYNEKKNDFLSKEENLFGEEYGMALCEMFTHYGLIKEAAKEVEKETTGTRFIKTISIPISYFKTITNGIRKYLSKNIIKKK